MLKEGFNILDMLMLVVVLAAFVPNTTDTISMLLNEDIGGFGTIIEKSAESTSGELNPIHRDMTTDDIMLMLLIADEYTPSPQKMVINLSGETRTVIDMGPSFVTDKIAELQSAFGSYSVRSDIKLQFTPEVGGDAYWEIVDRP